MDNEKLLREKLDKLKESLKYMTKDFNSEHAYVGRLLKHQAILEARNLLDKNKLDLIKNSKKYWRSNDTKT